MTFLDASGLIAMISDRDARHSEAKAVWRRLVRGGEPLLTTTFVLLECGNGMSRRRYRTQAVRLRQLLITSPQIDVVRPSVVQEAEAWERFGRRRDKEWGITDCVSFVVMEERGCREAFTGDHHFRQAGFTPLLPARGN